MSRQYECDFMMTTTIGMAKYFVTFINDFPNKIWLYPIKAKGECFDEFEEFMALVEKSCERVV